MKPYFDNPDGTIRFLTSTKTHKVNEVEASPDANAIFADEDGTWISVSGKVRVSSMPPTSTNSGRRMRRPGSSTARPRPSS